MSGRYLKVGLNLLVLALIGAFVRYMASSVNKEERAYVQVSQQDSTSFAGPCERLTAFELPATINHIETGNRKIYVSAAGDISVYDPDGNRECAFSVGPGVRDLAFGGGRLYVLYPTCIEVYSAEGDSLHRWEACSKLSDYCALTVTADYVFVTDAENKNICQYTTEGYFVKFIRSPRGFITPNYAFDIESYNDTVYCVNPGRHLVESYTADGTFIAAFGGPGGATGFFAGCSNPAHITFTDDGEILTSEKGNPRVCSYDRKGNFKGLILNNRLLGGGHEAYGIKYNDGRLYVAGKNKITVYRLR
jgi:hypothetical protein